MVRVGDVVSRVPVTLSRYDEEEKQKMPAMRGRVVYVHPKRRYHVVEFSTWGGPIRESFPGA